MAFIFEGNGKVPAPVILRLMDGFQIAFFGLDDGERRGASFYGKVDDHLGNLTDLGAHARRMGLFFHDPVGDRVQLVQTGTGMGIEIDDLLFASPQFLHTRDTFEHKSDIALQTSVDAIERFSNLVNPTRVADLNKVTGECRGAFFIKSQENR